MGLFSRTVLVFAAIAFVGGCGRAPVPMSGEAVATKESASPSAAPSPTPAAEIRTVTETVEIPFERVTRDDPTLASGKSVVSTKGVAGAKTLTYEVTLVGGVETGRKLVNEVVTKAPVAEVTRVGTKPASKPKPSCDPNYTGACVPIASDVDCEGGSGDGPAYVRGPVKVVGTDIYDLDRDNDGYGCE